MSIKGWLRKHAPYGDETYVRVQWQGPTSYTQVTAGSPPSGGDSITAAQLGVNMISHIYAMASYSGNFEVVPIRSSDKAWTLQWRALRSATIPASGPGSESQTTGTEAASGTNLSAEYQKLTINTVTG